jgi:hypothetical protein
MSVYPRPLASYALLFAAAALSAAAQTKTEPAHQEKFFGKWMLDRAASQVKHGAELLKMEWRTYAANGSAVRVAWGKGPDEQGTYSARCDGSLESDSQGKIRCWQTDAQTLEGEQIDRTDKTHRYYRRVVAADGRTMTITWFTDAKRTKTLDTFVYTKLD